MDRDAMVLYLGQLRDLEIAEATLPEEYAMRERQFYQEQNDLKYVRYESVPEEIHKQKATTLKFLPIFLLYYWSVLLSL